MSSLDDKTVNINIYKNNKDKIESSVNKSESYIIISNEELHNKNKELLVETTQLENTISDLENDNERMEKSITYQRGLLHNFNHLRNYEREKCTLHLNMINIYKEYILQLENNNKKLSIINKCNAIVLLLVVLLCLLTSLIEYYDFILLTFIVCFTYYCNTFMFNNYDNININNSLKLNINDIIKDIMKKDNEINKITSKSDFISELIDSA